VKVGIIMDVEASRAIRQAEVGASKTILRLRGPCGAQFEFTLAAIAQNLRRLAKLVARPPPFAPLCAA
jgi:hypothetical protein